MLMIYLSFVTLLSGGEAIQCWVVQCQWFSSCLVLVSESAIVWLQLRFSTVLAGL